jgi:hypothetical protein
MKIYITKYALTKGILLAETSTEDIEQKLKAVKGFPNMYFHPCDYAYSELEALTKAQELKAARIKSLQKSLKKLEALNIKITDCP